MRKKSYFTFLTQQLLGALQGSTIKKIYETPPRSRLETDNFVFLLEDGDMNFITLVVKKMSISGEKSVNLEDYHFCVEVYNYDCVSRLVRPKEREFWDDDQFLENYSICGVTRFISDQKYTYRGFIEEMSFNIESIYKDEDKGLHSYFEFCLTAFVREEDEVSEYFKKGEPRVYLESDSH